MYPFFPDPLFGWFFLAVLFALLAVAAWKDYQSMTVPKWLTVPALGLWDPCSMSARGVMFRQMRPSLPAWALGDQGPAVGGLDGLLFALAGFLVAFALFFLLWILGACGGGDVKLFAALGAWIGPGLTISVLIVTIGVVFCFLLGRMVTQLSTGRWKDFQQTANAAKPLQQTGTTGRHSRKRALSFALPLMISVALVLPWSLRSDLRLGAVPHLDANEKEHVHAR